MLLEDAHIDDDDRLAEALAQGAEVLTREAISPVCPELERTSPLCHRAHETNRFRGVCFGGILRMDERFQSFVTRADLLTEPPELVYTNGVVLGHPLFSGAIVAGPFYPARVFHQVWPSFMLARPSRVYSTLEDLLEREGVTRSTWPAHEDNQAWLDQAGRFYSTHGHRWVKFA